MTAHPDTLALMPGPERVREGIHGAAQREAVRDGAGRIFACRRWNPHLARVNARPVKARWREKYPGCASVAETARSTSFSVPFSRDAV